MNTNNLIGRTIVSIHHPPNDATVSVNRGLQHD
jgi:hypothetical protein